MGVDTPDLVLRRLTGRKSLTDALKWLGEGRQLPTAPNSRELFSALISVRETEPKLNDLAEKALWASYKIYLKSERDPAAELLDFNRIVEPAEYAAALDDLVDLTPSRTMRDITSAAVFAAQQSNPMVIPSLCAVAGVTYNELKARAAVPLPGKPEMDWTAQQCNAAFAVINTVVRGLAERRSDDAVPMRPIELLFAPDQPTSGWAIVEQLRSSGVPYEVLLAQRVVGTAWGAHRNATSGKVQEEITDLLCAKLDNAGVSHQRLRRDAASRARLAPLLHNGDQEDTAAQVMVLAAIGTEKLPIIVSVATDQGTANKSGAKLSLVASQFRVPAAVILVGRGWAQRTDTVELVRAFRGRVYSDLTMDQLVGDLTS